MRDFGTSFTVVNMNTLMSYKGIYSFKKAVEVFHAQSPFVAQRVTKEEIFRDFNKCRFFHWGPYFVYSNFKKRDLVNEHQNFWLNTLKKSAEDMLVINEPKKTNQRGSSVR